MENIINQPLVDREKHFFQQYTSNLVCWNIRALNVEGHCFQYICSKLPGHNYGKIKADVFDGPQIRILMRDPGFISSMDDTVKKHEIQSKASQWTILSSLTIHLIHECNLQFLLWCYEILHYYSRRYKYK